MRWRKVVTPGTKFGKLTVLKHDNEYHLCRCDCGQEKRVRTDHLIYHKILSCGCSKRPNLIGKTFGEWTVLQKGGVCPGGQRRWVCRCSCGREVEVKTHSLLHQESTRCRQCGGLGILRPNKIMHGKYVGQSTEQKVHRLLSAIETLEKKAPHLLNPCQDIAAVKASLSQKIRINTSVLNQLFGEVDGSCDS